MRDDGEDATDYKAVFVDTNLDTHLAIPVSLNDTAIDLKRKILAEHSKCFLEFGEIEILDLKVRCKGKLYTLSDLMPVSSVFAWTKKNWFVFADISSQFGHHDAADHNTKLFADPQIRTLPPASPLQGGLKNDERNLQTDNLSGEARSETLQLVADFNIDDNDNAKSSSSDTFKRLNAVVENICNFSFENEKVTVLRSGRKGRNSSGLLTEASSVNKVGKSSDVGSLEKSKPKKKRKITTNVHSLNGNNAVEIGSVDKDFASQKPEIMTGLDQNVDDCKHCDHVDAGVGSAGENKQTLAPYGEGDKIPESQDRDTQDIPIASDKTKGTTTKKNKRMTKAEMMNDETFSNIDALDNVSSKSHALSVDAFKECYSRNVGKNIANGQSEGNDISGAYFSTHIMPDSVTTEKHNLLLPDGGKNMNMHVQCNNNKVGSSINLDKDGTAELVGLESVPDVRDTEKEATTFGVALESGMRRSKKRKNGEYDVSHEVDTKGNGEHGVPDIEDEERQAEVLAELPELGMARPSKRKKTGFDLPDVIKMDGVCDERPGRSNSKHTKKSNKKAKQKQTPVIKNIAESMGDQRDTMDTEKSKSTRSKSGDEKDDNVQPSSSACEQNGIVAPVVTSEADIEITTKICVDEVLNTNHEINVRSQEGADATIHNDVEPMQLTQVQNSEEVAQTKNKRSSKKTKRKQHILANMSEFPVEDQKNNLNIDEKDDNVQPSSSACEQNGIVAPVVTSEADIETTTKICVDEVLNINHEINVKSQEGADVTIHNDVEPMQLTQVQKSEEVAETKNKRSSKKTKRKQNILANMSEFPVENQKNNLNIDRSKSACSESAAEKNDEMELPSSIQEKIDKTASVADANADIGSAAEKNDEMEPPSSFQEKIDKAASVADANADIGSAAEKNDEMELPSSFQEKIDEAASVADANADIEMRNAKVVGVDIVDDKVSLTNHESDVVPPKEVDETMHYDGEPMQLTQIQKSEKKNGSNSEKSKKKIKQKQSHPLKSISEFSVEDQNNSIKLERSKSTLSRSEAEKADRGSLSSPVEQVDNVSLISVPQPDAEVSKKFQVGVIITNHGSDISLQQKADDTFQDDVEPTQLTQAQRSRLDSEIKSVQTKKKTKQQIRTGKNVPKVVEGEQAHARNGISLEKDPKIDPVEVPLNAAIQYAAPDPLKSKIESSHSDVLNKRLHQGKATKELPKMKQSVSSLRKTSSKSTQKAARNPLKKKSLISKSSSIFKDESSSSAETKGGGDTLDSGTENPYDDHVSSSEDESRGSWASHNHGNSKDGGVASQSKPTEENLTMESILRSSHKYKKAKLVASQLQLQDEESQPVDVVPDSQVNA